MGDEPEKAEPFPQVSATQLQELMATFERIAKSTPKDVPKEDQQSIKEYLKTKKRHGKWESDDDDLVSALENVKKIKITVQDLEAVKSTDEPLFDHLSKFQGQRLWG